MLNALTVRKPAGFTIIEFMIAIVIMAVLMALALPSFRTWMQNIQIRNAGGAITNGLQKARAEAVARNTNVSFVLGTDSSWTVKIIVGTPDPVPPPNPNPDPDILIESRSSAENSQNVTVSILPLGATTVTFDSFGKVRKDLITGLPANTDGSTPITLMDISADGGTKNMRVTIGVGGNAKMCDPSLTTGSSPSAC
jgi:type IV fimbrial biogenesis protein FimT